MLMHSDLVVAGMPERYEDIPQEQKDWCEDQIVASPNFISMIKVYASVFMNHSYL